MVSVSVYDEDGELLDSQNIQASKAEIMNVLGQINNMQGTGLVHVQVGKSDPVAVSFDPEEIQEALEVHGQRGGFLGNLLSMIPIVGPILSGILKANMKKVKDQNPNLSHGEIMRKLAAGYKKSQ